MCLDLNLILMKLFALFFSKAMEEVMTITVEVVVAM